MGQLILVRFLRPGVLCSHRMRRCIEYLNQAPYNFLAIETHVFAMLGRRKQAPGMSVPFFHVPSGRGLDLKPPIYSRIMGRLGLHGSLRLSAWSRHVPETHV